MKTPSRKDAILVLVLTNLHDHYDKPQTFPPFGLSDHHTISVTALARKSGSAPDKFILKRDLRPSRKAEMVRYLCSLDWPLLFGSLESCDALLSVLKRLYTQDACQQSSVEYLWFPPWMTQHLKDLIQIRRQAFYKKGADSVLIKFYGNQVNWENQLCRTKFYESRVAHMKKEDPKAWWREMKRLSGGKVQVTFLIT